MQVTAGITIAARMIAGASCASRAPSDRGSARNVMPKSRTADTAASPRHERHACQRQRQHDRERRRRVPRASHQQLKRQPLGRESIQRRQAGEREDADERTAAPCAASA